MARDGAHVRGVEGQTGNEADSGVQQEYTPFRGAEVSQIAVISTRGVQFEFVICTIYHNGSCNMLQYTVCYSTKKVPKKLMYESVCTCFELSTPSVRKKYFVKKSCLAIKKF